MEQEPRNFPKDFQPIEPDKAVISDEGLLADAATGTADTQQLQTETPLVTSEENRAENPYSR